MHQIRLHVYKMLALAAAAAALVLVNGSASAMAQDHVYFLGYYANANTPGAPDGTLRLANDANVSDTSPAGDLCASIYVFDNRERIAECCTCKVTPNGYLSLSVNQALTSDPLGGGPQKLTRGLIKVLSSARQSEYCDPTHPVLKRGIRAWITHPEALATKGQYSLSVEQLTDSTLGSPELADLPEDCGVILELDVGGICDCTDSGR